MFNKKKFSALLAVLIYAHTLIDTKCRRRLMGRLRKLRGFDKGKVGPEDRFYILRSCEGGALEDIQKAVDVLMISFQKDFR
jgi:hypothetical protein